MTDVRDIARIRGDEAWGLATEEYRRFADAVGDLAYSDWDRPTSSPRSASPQKNGHPHHPQTQGTPAEAYAALPKPEPTGRGPIGHYQLRYDRVDQGGAISLRRAGRMHHLGIGAHHATKRVLAIADHATVTVFELETGEMLFLAYTGVRFGEMAALRVGRLDLRRRRAVIVESVTPVQGIGLVWGTTKTHQRRGAPTPVSLPTSSQSTSRTGSSTNWLSAASATGSR